MLVFWGLLIIVILIQFLPSKNTRTAKVKLIASLFFLFLYGAFRFNYGLDYQAYLDYFDEVKRFGLESDNRMELGYYYLNKNLPSFRSLLIVQTTLMCTSFYYLFKWYVPTKWYWLGFLLLFLGGPVTIFFMLSGIRNGIALSIFILATYFIYKRKLKEFALLIFIAYWFHNSVIIFAPAAYFVANGKPITKRSLIIWIAVMVFLAIASSTIVLDYANIFITTYFDRYSTYVIQAGEQAEGAGVLVSLFSIIGAILLLLIVKGKEMTAKENMIVKLSMLFFLSFLLGPLNVRMSQYFAPFFVVGSVLAMYKGTNKELKAAYIIAVFIFLLYSLKVWIEGPYFSYELYESVF
jgi:hypothetical protein